MEKVSDPDTNALTNIVSPTIFGGLTSSCVELAERITPATPFSLEFEKYILLSKRIVEAKKQPKGLDFVTDNPQEWREPREVHSQPK